jgi:hypothetical protein
MIGVQGPRFAVQAQDYSMEEIAQDQLAEFLNEATGRNGSEREISEKLEKDIVSDFFSFLSEEKDIYKGCKSIEIPRQYNYNFDTQKSQQFKSIGQKKDESVQKITGVNNTHIKDGSGKIQPTKGTPLWWKEESSFDKIVQLAENVLRSFPNSRIYSLGQSPAWIIKASEMLASYHNKRGEFGYIPFSGSFLGAHQARDYDYGERPFPSKEAQASYRKLLKDIGLSPTEIISRYTEKGQKTTILEYTNSGRSIASFALILFSWAKKEQIKLDDALDIVTFARYNSLPPVKCIEIYRAGIYAKCKNIFTENDLLVVLANRVDNGSNSDRLVPSYPHKSWCVPPVQLVENKEHVAVLTQQLEKAILKYLTISINLEINSQQTEKEQPNTTFEGTLVKELGQLSLN